MFSVNRQRRMHRLLLCAATFLLFILCYSPWSGNGADDMFYYTHISSPLFDGDVVIANDIAHSANIPRVTREVLGRINPETGQTEDPYAAGNGVLLLPFVGAVRAVAIFLDRAGVPPPPDWNWRDDRYSRPYLHAVSLGTSFYGLLTVILIYEACRRRFTPRASFWAALGALGGTQLLGYAFAYGMMSHTHSSFAVALLLWALVRSRHFRHTSDYLVVGAAMGLVALVRWQDATMALIPAALWGRAALRRGWSGWRSEAARLAAALAGFLSVFSVQNAFWIVQTGRLFTMPQGDDYMSWGAPRIAGVLFSGWHGLFVYHPLLLVGAAGLVLLAGSRRAGSFFARALMAAFLVQVYVNACPADWMAMGSFGSRRFCSSVPLLAFGLAAAFHRLERRPLRFLPPFFVGSALAVNFALLAIVVRGLHDTFVWHELWQLKSEWLAHAGWLATLPLGSYIMANLFVPGGNPLEALYVAAAGAVMTAGAAAVVLHWTKGGARHGNRLPGIAWGSCAICLAMSSWIVAVRPPPDTDALELRAALLGGKDSPEFTAAVRRHVDKNGACLFAWVSGAQLPDPAVRKRCHAVLYEKAPRTWAQIIQALPPQQVSTGERIGSATVPFGAKNLLDLCLTRINLMRRASARARADVVREILRFYPVSPRFLLNAVEAEKAAEHHEAARRHEQLLARVGEVQLASARRRRQLDPFFWADGIVHSSAVRSLVLLRQQQRKWMEAAEAAWIGLQASTVYSFADQQAWMRRHALMAEAHLAVRTGNATRLRNALQNAPGLSTEDRSEVAGVLSQSGAAGQELLIRTGPLLQARRPGAENPDASFPASVPPGQKTL